MGASQALVARDILDAYPLNPHAHLLDVGGGEGAFAVEAARSAPRLHVTLFDLPPVAARAERRFAAEGLAGRMTARGGSFHEGLPHGADAVSLVRVIHDHDDGPALALLKAARAALPPGGTLLLAEPMAGTPGAEPVGDAYFGFYLLAMGSGRPRTAANSPECSARRIRAGARVPDPAPDAGPPARRHRPLTDDPRKSVK